MNMLFLSLKEMRHRKLNSFLSFIAVATAVALFVAFFTTGDASNRETTRLMRDMGFNLRIIPKDTDMSDFLIKGYSEKLMPEEYVNVFGRYGWLSYNHLTTMLHRQIDWEGRKAILTGISSEEIAPPGKKKSLMTLVIKPGTAFLGYQLAQDAAISQGNEITIMGERFRITKIMNETGTSDDLRIYVNLDDAQRLLGAEGKINEIKALECICFDDSIDTLAMLREQLDRVLPEAKVVQLKNIAQARTKQRIMMRRYFSLILPIVTAVCAVWVGALAMMNVRDRVYEIGLLKSLGRRSGQIAVLFLSKAVLIGIVGAITGFVIGTAVSLIWGPAVFKVTAGGIRPMYSLLLWSLLAAPGFAALSCLIPSIYAATQDPAVTLNNG